MPDTMESPVREMVKMALNFSFSTNFSLKKKPLLKKKVYPFHSLSFFIFHILKFIKLKGVYKLFGFYCY